MSPLSTEYVERGCNIHGPSFHTVTRPSMARCTLRNMALFFLVFICVSYVQHSVALQPYHHSGVVIAPHEDMDDFLLVEAHDEEEALPSFSPIRYTASPSGYIDDAFARLHLRQAGVQHHDFARVVSSALIEEGSMSQASVTSNGFGPQYPKADSADRHLCDAIMSLAGNKNPETALSGNFHFKLVYHDSDVIIFQKAKADGRETTIYPAKRRYSYSKVTGITHGSYYTQVVMDLALFHKDFVTAYDSDIRPVSMKGSVKEILFSKPITLSVETDPAGASKMVKVAGELYTFTFKVNALKSLFATSDQESTKRLELIQEYFNTVISAYYGSGKPDFNSGAGIPDRVKTELAEVIEVKKKAAAKGGKKVAFKVVKKNAAKAAKKSAAKGVKKSAAKAVTKNTVMKIVKISADTEEDEEKDEEGFDIRANDGHYNVIDIGNKNIMYYKVGLDEIHRCMHQRINLVRAFCNPYTGAVNTGDFTKSTAFATDYMRIPTGQTILDYQIVVDKAAKKGAVLVSTHVSTTDMTSQPFEVNGVDITFQKFDFNKSPQFHVARTLAAFEWPVNVSPVVDYIIDQLTTTNTLPAGLTSAQLKTALEAPFVYDRMNGYLEELTSVARTVNPETIVSKLMAAVGVASNDVKKQREVRKQIEEAFTGQLKYPLGTYDPRMNGQTHDPRKNIVDRVKRKVMDLITETSLSCPQITKQRIAALLFNWMHERVKIAFERERNVFYDNFADVAPFVLESITSKRQVREGESSTDEDSDQINS